MFVFICSKHGKKNIPQHKSMDCFLHQKCLTTKKSLGGDKMFTYKICFLLALRSFSLYKVITVDRWTVTCKTLFEKSRSRKKVLLKQRGDFISHFICSSAMWYGGTASSFIQGPPKVPTDHHSDPLASARLSGAQKQHDAKQRHGSWVWRHISRPVSFC